MALDQAAEDLLDGDTTGRGMCAQGSDVINVMGVDVEGCVLITEENIGRLVTLSGIAATGGSYSLGQISTNAKNIEDLSGWGVCAGGGVLRYGLTVCASLEADGTTPTGTFAIISSVSVASGGGGWFTYGQTKVDEVMKTPKLLRAALRHNGKGTSFMFRNWMCNNNLLCQLDAADDLFGPPSEEIAPGPLGEPSGGLA